MPSWRKPVGMAIILTIIVVWSVIVASFSGPIGRLNGMVQGVIYLVAGLIWILPLKPLLRWMETGVWRDR